MSPAVLVMLLSLPTGQSALAAEPTSSAMDQLANDKGCYLCHAVKPVNGKPGDLLPYAPSWTDIAAKYKGQRDAEDRLTQIVLGGSGHGPKDRHWQGKVSDVGMLPNVPEIDEVQARQLVHWLLSFAP